MTTDRVTTINALSVLCDCLEARLDETPLETTEEVHQAWSLYSDAYREHERVNFSVERMFRLRERIERAEAQFRCYNEILEEANEWSPAFSVLSAAAGGEVSK